MNIISAQRCGMGREVQPAHPAVAAITYVVNHEPRLIREGHRGDPVVMRAALARFGFDLSASGITAHYLGKCPVPGGTGEHIVLTTSLGSVTLILVPDQLLGARTLVSDCSRSALVDTIRGGSYILIAESPQHVQRVERLLL